MAVATFNLKKCVLSKYSLFSITAIPKRRDRNWVSFATLNFMKPINRRHAFPCNNQIEIFTIKSRFLCSNKLRNVNTMWTITNQPVRWSTSTTDSSNTQPQQEGPQPPQLSNKDKLKRAIKEYGATVTIFHVTISLISLGATYLAVTSGVDMSALLTKIGIGTPGAEQVSSGTNMLGTTGDVATEVGTFVVAYAIHKVFAPVRISITLLCTPLIVRHLRKIGFLKPPKPSGI